MKWYNRPRLCKNSSLSDGFVLFCEQRSRFPLIGINRTEVWSNGKQFGIQIGMIRWNQATIAFMSGPIPIMLIMRLML